MHLPRDNLTVSELLIAQNVLGRASDRLGEDATTLLTGRAALLGLGSRGRTSVGGATRLLATRDGWCALTLSRDDDIALVPALVQADTELSDPWQAITAWAAAHDGKEVRERARLLDLPIALLGETPAEPPLRRSLGARQSIATMSGLLVADLTSMWAGPLCGQLLARQGATVVKVENPLRPDGTRAGDPRFFDWMNTGKLCCTVDFDQDRQSLRDLLDVADVVLEGSRPAALSSRGLGPDDVTPRPGRVWLRITGYGTGADGAGRVAFGDDAAVAGGLVCEGPTFLGDAIADPLTGIEAFLAVRDSLHAGGGELIELAMAAVAADYATDAGGSIVVAAVVPDEAPPAAHLGADNIRVQALLTQRRTGPC